MRPRQNMIFPRNYKPLHSVKETEHAIKNLKDFVELNLATELNLSRVTAPLFVQGGTGINDDLNGVERPVAFPIKDMPGVRAEIVQSLAKWKRLALGDLGFKPGYGLYTDMNALRPDETLDNTHSIYVDQWDWERVITPAERNVEFLTKIVRKIYSLLKRTEHFICERYPNIHPELPEEITFIHAEELRAKYPKLSPKQREHQLLLSVVPPSSWESAAISAMAPSTTAGLRIMMIGPPPRREGAKDSTVTSCSGIRCSRWRLSCPPWASAWIKKPCCGN